MLHLFSINNLDNFDWGRFLRQDLSPHLSRHRESLWLSSSMPSTGWPKKRKHQTKPSRFPHSHVIRIKLKNCSWLFVCKNRNFNMTVNTCFARCFVRKLFRFSPNINSNPTTAAGWLSSCHISSPNSTIATEAPLFVGIVAHILLLYLPATQTHLSQPTRY